MGKKIKKVSSSSSLSSLPDEIVLDCLVRVPRRYYESVSSVSVRLRSLVRSPELHRLRSLLHKESVYVCFCERDNFRDPTYLWFTLRQTTTAEYQLVPIPFPCRKFMFRSSTVAVDSEIYFISEYPKPTEMWILDTRSGKLRQGPIMRESRFAERSAVGVFDGKMYVTQELKNGSIQEEIFDLESQTWKVPGVAVPEEKVDTRRMMQSCVTLEGKVYAMNNGSITIYNLKQGRRKEKLEMPIGDWVWHVCLVDNLLFALFTRGGLMWLDTNRNVWRAVSGDVQPLHRTLYSGAMAEYYGKLLLFWRETHIGTSTNKKQDTIWCALIALARVGEEVCGTIEWSGVVATLPYVSRVLHCVVASD